VLLAGWCPKCDIPKSCSTGYVGAFEKWMGVMVDVTVSEP
jgi:hypothetical protein